MSDVALLMRLIPGKMRLGADEYEIEKVNIPPHENAWGQLDHNSYTIHVGKDAPNSKQLAKTVIHEALHGIWGDRNLPPDQEEKTIEQVASGLIAMFIDNPWIIPWLQRALHK